MSKLCKKKVYTIQNCVVYLFNAAFHKERQVLKSISALNRFEKKSKTAFLRSELVPQCTVHSHTAAQNHNKQNVGCLIKVQIKSIESTQISCKCRLNRICYNDLRNICVYFIQTFEPYHWNSVSRTLIIDRCWNDQMEKLKHKSFGIWNVQLTFFNGKQRHAFTMSSVRLVSV